MITHALLNFATFILGGLVGAVDAVPIPDASGVVDPIESGAYTLSQHVIGLSNWIPFSDAGAAMGILGIVLVAGFAIRILRMGLSLFTGGGGTGA